MEFKIGTESISKVMAGTTEITDFIVPEPTPGPTPGPTPLLEVSNGNLTVNKGGLLFTTVYSSGSTSYSMDPYEGDTATITDFVNVQDTLINEEDNDNRMYFSNSAFSPAYNIVNVDPTFYELSSSLPASLDVTDSEGNTVGTFTPSRTGTPVYEDSTKSYISGNSGGNPSVNTFRLNIGNYYYPTYGTYAFWSKTNIYLMTSKSISYGYYCANRTGVTGYAYKANNDKWQLFDMFSYNGLQPNTTYNLYLGYGSASSIEPGLIQTTYFGVRINSSYVDSTNMYLCDANGVIIQTASKRTFEGSNIAYFSGNCDVTSDENGMIKLYVVLDGYFASSNWPSYNDSRSQITSSRTLGAHAAYPRLVDNTPWLNKPISLRVSGMVEEEYDYKDKFISVSRYPETEQEILASPETFGYIYADANKNITSSGIILNPNYGVITESQGE